MIGALTAGDVENRYGWIEQTTNEETTMTRENSKDSVVKYETAIKSGSFLLLAHGTAADVSRAKEIVSSTQPVESAAHLP